MCDLYLYQVNPNYLRFLHSFEQKVSVKYNNRPFVGIVTMINGINYLIPLTSQTTSEREKDGKKKRSAVVTTFVRDSSGEEIANLLHNNMIPVIDDVCSKLEINTANDTYQLNEIRFIRKNRDKIIAKAQKVHDQRLQGRDRFLRWVCCDYKLLEDHYQEFALEQEA